jgi:hypothetical protein
MTQVKPLIEHIVERELCRASQKKIAADVRYGSKARRRIGAR